MDEFTPPWPAYAAAHVEIAAPGRWLVLEPRTDPAEAVRRGTEDHATPWSELTRLLGVPARTTVWIVTASDPHPQVLDDASNAVRARQLVAALDARGLVHLDASARSPDGSVREESRAVLGATRTVVRDVAAEFAQLAVFEIADELACVATADGRVVTSRPYSVEALEA
jgi:hypothetical protein